MSTTFETVCSVARRSDRGRGAVCVREVIGRCSDFSDLVCERRNKLVLGNMRGSVYRLSI